MNQGSYLKTRLASAGASLTNAPVFLAIPAMLIVAGWAYAAAPTITPAGAALGFTITTFATVNPATVTFGPFGIAVATNTNIIVSNFANNTRYVWPDVDGQTVGSAITRVSSA